MAASKTKGTEGSAIPGSGDPPASDPDGSTVSRQEFAYARLRADIVNGLISPGAPLQEAALSSRLGISRTPLREAIRRLAEEGLVEVLPYRGARVTNLDVRRLEDLFDLREAIEGMVARLAATKMRPAEVVRSRQSLRAGLRDLARRPAYRAPAFDFHREVLRSAGNSELTDAARRLYARLLLARTISGAFQERAGEAAREHLRILRAIARRDPDAAERLMRRHIRRSRENLLRFVESTSRMTSWTA